MVTADEVIAGVSTNSAPIYGIIKPNPDDPTSVLFAQHADASRWVAIPASMIAHSCASGTKLSGLADHCKSACLALQGPNTPLEETLAQLVSLQLRPLGIPDPHYCYDQEGHVIPCPPGAGAGR